METFTIHSEADVSALPEENAKKLVKLLAMMDRPLETLPIVEQLPALQKSKILFDSRNNKSADTDYVAFRRTVWLALLEKIGLNTQTV
ncbi:MAG TPA: hypothetical protein VLH19_01230 [Patescibacteria group bacterium]|nr:hypothetical protein [Patescibacteria group bacterium]